MLTLRMLRLSFRDCMTLRAPQTWASTAPHASSSGCCVDAQAAQAPCAGNIGANLGLLCVLPYSLAAAGTNGASRACEQQRQHGRHWRRKHGMPSASRCATFTVDFFALGVTPLPDPSSDAVAFYPQLLHECLSSPTQTSHSCSRGCPQHNCQMVILVISVTITLDPSVCFSPPGIRIPWRSFDRAAPSAVRFANIACTVHDASYLVALPLRGSIQVTAAILSGRSE